ncbi:MAG: ABC transporter substrate-binding protein [Synergistales bacterium]|nr:ABC transporter substrate-binding protein [Synergistales bacterium]
MGLGMLLAAGAACAAEDPVYGGTVRWREINDPPKLDPAMATDTVSSRNLYLMYDMLVENDPDGQGLLPRLAESWEGSEGGTVFTFHLRKGVHFQKESLGEPTKNGGREVVASDWKYSFERLVKVTSPRAYFIDMVKGYQDFVDGKTDEWTGIKVVDDHTLQFELEYPFAPFVAVLAYNSFMVVPREDAEHWGKDFNFHPVGTGPFILEEWNHDQNLVYRRNPDYWRTDAEGRELPYLDGVEIVIIPDNTVAYEEFKKGNIDCFPDFPDEYYRAAKEEFGSQLQERPWLGTYYYGFNNQKEPFKDNKKLRQALNYAVNREMINDLVIEGRYYPGKGVLPPGMFAYNEDLEGYSFNPEKARKLMAEAGYPDGFSCRLNVNNNPRHKAVAEAIQGQLMQLGIELDIHVLDWGVHLDLAERGETEMFRMGWVVDYADPDNFLYVLLSSENWGPKGNYSFYKNEEVDALLKEARVETDQQKRKELYQKAEQIIVDDAPWIFLFHYTTSLLVQDWVENVHLPAMGDYATPLYNVWTARQ